MIFKKIKKNKGFVILFAVTLSSIVLAIALGIANITLKEINFTTSTRYANEAFFAADAGAECALFYDRTSFERFPLAGPAQQLFCLGPAINPTFTAGTNTGTYEFTILGLGASDQACAKVTVFKDNTVTPMNTIITSRGYNIGDAACNSTNPNRVERRIKVDFAAVPPVYNVVWTSASGVNIVGNNLTKSAPGDIWGNSGAVSTRAIPSGGSGGYVQFSTNETNSYKMAGLSNGNSDTGYADIDYGLYPATGGLLHVYEKGIYKGTFGSYNAGDIFIVGVYPNGTVNYYQNGTLFYTSLTTATFPLLLDTALYTANSTIINAKISY